MIFISDEMPLNIKIIFTIFVIIIGLLIIFLTPKKKNAGPDWIWRFGKDDPFRNLFFNPDGSMKHLMKTLILVVFAVLLSIVWILIPAIK